MKQKDIVLIIVVVFFAAVVSLLLTKAVFVTDKDRNVSVEEIDPISSEFKQPDTAVFNNNAINPTQLIQIGDNANSTPF